jgi:hypothetical protein
MCEVIHILEKKKAHPRTQKSQITQHNYQVLKNSRVVPARPMRAGRAEPAPWNDDVALETTMVFTSVSWASGLLWLPLTIAVTHNRSICA